MTINFLPCPALSSEFVLAMLVCSASSEALLDDAIGAFLGGGEL